MNESDYQEHLQHMIDAVREANYALWNTILTINGILMGIFASVAVLKADTKIYGMFIVTLSILSCVCIIQNILFSRNIYRLIGLRSAQELTNAQIQTDYAEAEKQKKRADIREKVCYAIFMIQGISILLLIQTKAA